jgi:hypothetical protein
MHCLAFLFLPSRHCFVTFACYGIIYKAGNHCRSHMSHEDQACSQGILAGSDGCALE